MFSTKLYFISKNMAIMFASELLIVLGIRAKVVRTSFMYLTFVTLGFGFALYLFIAFWMRIKDLLYTKRSSVFDL